jgi:flagellar basal-body rod protein FlgC
MLSVYRTASAGLRVAREWLDATADNVANLNTIRPTSEPAYQARRVVVETGPVTADDPAGADPRVVGIALGDPRGRIVHDPGHPLADAEGTVRLPDMDLSDEMVHLILAQRVYQANLSVADRATDAYRNAISIAG